MSLKRWEIQVLLLLAEDPKSAEGKDLFAEYAGRFSSDAREMAQQIMEVNVAGKSSKKRIVESAKAFIRRANSRNAERETRELAYVG